MDRRLSGLSLGILVAALATASPASARGVRWVPVGGDQLAYVESGKGEPIVLIHGGFQDYRLWLGHLPRLANSYRVVAYSRRNHFPNARSADGAADFDAELHATDLARVIRKLGLGRVHIVAHSAGAHAALFLAARNPDLVRSLVVNEPPAGGLIEGAEAAKAAANFQSRFALAMAALRVGDIESGIRHFADAVGGRGGFDRRSEAQKAMMLDNVSAHIADARSKKPRPRFTCAMAAKIQAPVLIMTGTRSPAFFHHIVDRLAQCLPNSGRVSIDASHSVPAENPAAFSDAVVDFLSGKR